MGHALQCFKVLHHEHCKILYLLLLLLPKQHHLTASHFQPILWHPNHWQPQVVSTTDLLWSQHITSITKANSTLGFLRRNPRHSPTSCRRNAYLALVRPVLEYAAIFWDPHTQQEINMLERFVAKDYRSTTPGFITGLLRKHELTTLQERQLQLRLGIFYKVVEGLVSAITPCDFITPQKPSSPRVTKGRTCHKTQSKTTLGTTIDATASPNHTLTNTTIHTSQRQ